MDTGLLAVVKLCRPIFINASSAENYGEIPHQGPHSFSLFELKTFLKTFSTTLTTYCKKIAIFLRRFKDSLMFIMQAI